MDPLVYHRSIPLRLCILFPKIRSHEKPGYMAWIFVLPWFFHILIDIPGHTLRFFPTPFLHPFSDMAFDGVRWSTWWFWFPQLFALLGIWWVILEEKITFFSGLEHGRYCRDSCSSMRFQSWLDVLRFCSRANYSQSYRLI